MLDLGDDPARLKLSWLSGDELKCARGAGAPVDPELNPRLSALGRRLQVLHRLAAGAEIEQSRRRVRVGDLVEGEETAE